MPPPARPPLKVVLKDLFSYEHKFFGPNDAIIFFDLPTGHHKFKNEKKNERKIFFDFVDPGLEPGTYWMTLAL